MAPVANTWEQRALKGNGKSKKIKAKSKNIKSLKNVNELLENFLRRRNYLKPFSEAIRSKLIELQQREPQAAAVHIPCPVV